MVSLWKKKKKKFLFHKQVTAKPCENNHWASGESDSERNRKREFLLFFANNVDTRKVAVSGHSQ